MIVDPALRMGLRPYNSAVVAQPDGVLDSSTYPELRDTLIKAAAEQPRALLVDVDRLTVASAPCLSVFATVRARVSEWPGVPVLLVATDPARRSRLAASPVARFVPVYGDLDAALRAAGRPPARRRDRITLAATPVSSGAARAFVARLCRRWGIAAMIEDAVAVATELVENAIQHTRNCAELRVELYSGMLSVVVSDHDPRPAVLRETSGRTSVSPGLAIVSGLARRWGYTPTATGKIVWALLRIPCGTDGVASPG